MARLLVELFEVRFDPARQEAEREARARAIVAEIERLLDAVANLDEDRILRRFLNLDRGDAAHQLLPAAPKAAGRSPTSRSSSTRAASRSCRCRGRFREIFVYSPRVEAVHLRGGKVARGGIRWSDRREDFRTEVLGLMKAQMVKNAVIVPVGSKGGFVVKRQPPPEAGREKLMAEVVDCYKTMMRGLLDLTDNLRGDEVVPPPDVVRRDDDDPYLVVAADKGTATFSDIANAHLRRVRLLARRRLRLRRLGRLRPQEDGDHLARRLGVGQAPLPRARQGRRDARTSPCVGVGDMSGDVFGNGMLRSPHIKLLAAFDHRHIFVDPDPDPAASFAERQRLFELPRSSWADYDPQAHLARRRRLRARRQGRSPSPPRCAPLFGARGRAGDARPS